MHLMKAADVVSSHECYVVLAVASQLEPVDCSSTLTQPHLITDADSTSRDAAAGTDDLSGYLASYYAQTLGPGRPDCPWTIAVRPGQRIQLTLVDFSARYRLDPGHLPGDGPPASAASAGDPAELCYRYAEVSEGGGGVRARGRRYTVCAEESREQVVYTSSSNVVHVQIADPVVADTAVNFLIKYTGKPDNQPASHELVQWSKK